jgi:uncharacterized protein
MRIIITGATGFIGSKLTQSLIERGNEVTIFTRNEKVKNVVPGVKDYVKWDYKNPAGWRKYIDGKDAVIHLAGANLFAKRWDDKYKKIILESRELSTSNLAEAISNAEKKPAVFICSSGIGFYGDSGDTLLTEDAPNGNDFIASVCRKWEEAAAVNICNNQVYKRDLLH